VCVCVCVYHKDLGPEAQLIDAATLSEVLIQRQEEGPTHQVIHHALKDFFLIKKG
jgi:hypothetical protein